MFSLSDSCPLPPPTFPTPLGWCWSVWRRVSGSLHLVVEGKSGSCWRRVGTLASGEMSWTLSFDVLASVILLLLPPQEEHTPGHGFQGSSH